MTAANALRLLSLAAIWGASFLFMRIAAPALGSVWLAGGRVLGAALFLLLCAAWLKRLLALRVHARHFLILGLFNSALPFWLYSHAAQHLSASLMAILNATAPLWGALIAALLSRQALPARVAFGLFLGVAGVALLVGLTPQQLSTPVLWAVLACLGAALCYGIASNYARGHSEVDAFSNAHGSMWAASFLLLPWLPTAVPAQMPGWDVAAAVLALGVVCSGVAYLLYFRLLAELGAAQALTVTFLIPLFGVLWGWLFLHEPVGWHTAGGALVVLLGTALVTGFNPGVLWRKAELSA